MVGGCKSPGRLLGGIPDSMHAESSWVWVRNLAFKKSDPSRALLRFVLVRVASPKLASTREDPLRSAPLRLALMSLTPCSLALVRVAPLRSALTRLAYNRSAPLRLALLFRMRLGTA